MKEITRIHLAKVPYEIEIEAKKKLSSYFDELKKCSGEEIFEDVEIRVTEILSELGVNKNGIITKKEVEKIRTQIGEPEVFQDENMEEGEEIQKESPEKQPKKLYRDESNGLIGGVASGLAEYFNIDVVIVRILMLCSVPFSFGWSVIFYVVMILIVPKAKTTSDILRLRGKKITANSIKEVSREYDFEKQKKRNKRIVRAFSVFFGLMSAQIAIGGIAALWTGNIALNEAINPTYFEGVEDYRTIFTILLNIGGVIFVAFFSVLTVVGFTAKFTRANVISLIVLFILGIFCAISIGFTAFRATIHASNKIASSYKTETVKIDTEKLGKIKSINVKGLVPVEYIVSDERKIVVSEFGALPKTQFEFDGETLNIFETESNPQKNQYRQFGSMRWFRINGTDLIESIKIYGPELSQINSGDNSFFYNNNNQKELEVKTLNGDFSTNLSGEIEKLKISQYGGRFLAENLNAKNLEISSDHGAINLADFENGNVKTLNCYGSGAAVSLRVRREKDRNLNLNGHKFTEDSVGQCFWFETAF